MPGLSAGHFSDTMILGIVDERLYKVFDKTRLTIGLIQARDKSTPVNEHLVVALVRRHPQASVSELAQRYQVTNTPGGYTSKHTGTPT